MENGNDSELLREFARDGKHEAFESLVARYLNLVYSAALRQVHDRELARDVTQSLFVLLARKAGKLSSGVILSAWLYRAAGFVAADAMKSETRRRKREEAAMMNFPIGKDVSVWAEMEPVLDEAVCELSARDRELVVMRFFENRSLREIGKAMGTSEDAAQKRVSRALDRLRQKLGQKGVTVTSTAAAAALAAYSCQGAPTGMATVIAAATGGSTAIGLSIFTKGAIDFMAITKTQMAVAGIVLVAMVTTPMVAQKRTISELRHENAELKEQIAQSAALAAAEQQQAAPIEAGEIERLKSEAAEVHRLRAQVSALTQTAAKEVGRRKTSAPATDDADSGLDAATAGSPTKRMQLAGDLVKTGDYANALKHYLWCYDEGIKNDPSFVGVRGSFLLKNIMELAAKYPGARDELAKRRDDLEASVRDGRNANPLAAMDYARLAQALNEPDRIVQFYDQLAGDNPGRKMLTQVAAEEFIKERRYTDLVTSGDPEGAFEQALLPTKMGIYDKQRDDLKALMRDRIVSSGALNVEALAGAGEVDRAVALAGKVLAFDNSPATRTKLVEAVTRAGNATLAARLQGN